MHSLSSYYKGTWHLHIDSKYHRGLDLWPSLHDAPDQETKDYRDLLISQNVFSSVREAPERLIFTCGYTVDSNPTKGRDFQDTVSVKYKDQHQKQTSKLISKENNLKMPKHEDAYVLRHSYANYTSEGLLASWPKLDLNFYHGKTNPRISINPINFLPSRYTRLCGNLSAFSKPDLQVSYITLMKVHLHIRHAQFCKLCWLNKTFVSDLLQCNDNHLC